MSVYDLLFLPLSVVSQISSGGIKVKVRWDKKLKTWTIQTIHTVYTTHLFFHSWYKAYWPGLVYCVNYVNIWCRCMDFHAIPILLLLPWLVTEQKICVFLQWVFFFSKICAKSMSMETPLLCQLLTMPACMGFCVWSAVSRGCSVNPAAFPFPPLFVFSPYARGHRTI